MKEVEVADILTGIGSMRQTPKFVSKTNKARKTAKEVSNKLEGLIPKTDKAKDILPKVKKKVPDVLEGAKNLKKYYKNAYKVADNQRREAIVGKYPELLVRNEKIPSEIFLEGNAYKEILRKHSDFKNINFNQRLGFVETINSPSLYKKVGGKKARINLIKDLDGFDKKTLNIVGTKPIPANKKAYVNTSFLANKKRDVKKVLSDGRPGPSSPIGVSSRISHLDKTPLTSPNYPNNSIKFPKNQEYTPIQNMSAVRKFFTSGDTILRRAGNSGRELADLIQKQRKEADLLRGKYETIIRDALGRMRKKDRLAVTDILEEIKSKNTYLGKCFLLENQRF